ncbi:hypothetical protein CAS74_000112 [Pichia kudriavzevii]|uniref:Ubiquitin-related modifier 1 n=1 Tax=Pichia kudriavzevii TaxID=4909 RepID=A0A099NUE6_PICKU|nr:uncharacterized protein C5L36_0C01080 [Pichia kudriavzevii]AWU76162.1 hypothetical protein C5L36_0C01080 [Pichia kudriavzevii]KGK36418.1 hypothetical protein JL09_g4427 [Pichia kudriavzevii]ONH72015.1 Ubiquitin-related modifier 1 [Pichia kudriavzevii]OUT23744.1 hypothetical protein CAS74_000112 [Pichia kudriavzevii]
MPRAEQQACKGNMGTVSVKVELLGGMDQVFHSDKTLKLKVSSPSNEVTVKDLIDHMAGLIDNPRDLDMFIQEETVRPGILVLINDTDWELEDKEEYILEDGDLVSFTSTLHGG